MVRKTDYSNWSKEELIKELDRLKETTYGLVWHRDLPEERIDILINPDARTPQEVFPNEMKGRPFPVLKEEVSKALNIDKNKPTNLLIEGDNYHSLAVLNVTHQESIDLIYIDPPYNTGNKSWKYNNDFVDKDDAFRHSKFLAFMQKRLQLARTLLKNSGIIIVAIDDHEIFPLGMLMDEIFEERNKIGTAVVVHNPGGRQDELFMATSHEYMLIYAKNISEATFNNLSMSDKKFQEYKYEDEYGRFKLREFRRSGANSRKTDRPNLWYPIYVNPETGEASVNKTVGSIEVLPEDPKGIMRVWRWSPRTFMEKRDKYIVTKINNGVVSFYVKERESDSKGEKPKTIWNKSEYSAVNGTNALKNLLEEEFGDEKIFEYPKSPFLMKDILQVATKKDSVVLDFFAGSGTTGEALLALNNEDGGSRRFILCTNNELNGQERLLRERGLSEEDIQQYGICRRVTYPRLKAVMLGKQNNIEGLGGNLKYFTSYDFVEAKETDANKRKLVNKSTEMLCIKEDAFELVKDEDGYKIFKGKDNYLGIVFYEDSIEAYVTAIASIQGHFNTYVFSLGDDTHEQKFYNVIKKVTLCAIPEVILKVYREIFK